MRLVLGRMLDFFANIKSYIGFADDEAAALQDLLALAEPHLERITEHFYEAIAAHPDALAALQGPAQIPRLRKTLEQWLRSGLEGPHGDDFVRHRWHIGQRHVAIGVPQHFMLTAMNVIRLDYHRIIELALPGDFERRCRLHAAMDKLLDLELAIILQSYLEDSKERMARRERLASIGELAGNVAHELRNPLGVIESSAYLMRKQAGLDARATVHVDRVTAQVARCNAIVHNLLELARNRTPRHERVAVAAVLDSALHTLIIPDNVTVQRDVDDELAIDIDPNLLRHALANLMSNAVAAYDGAGGLVRLCARATDDGVVIEVADEGPGFEPAVLARAFEPLVTTRGDGVGLGLALVRNITQLHGGTVEAGNAATGGARVRIHLPHRREEPR